MAQGIGRLLVANRGEIALRVFRAAQAMGIATVGVAPRDDPSPHARRCDELVELPGNGPAAYLDPEAVVRAARDTSADAVHPGYGFLSESAELAEACRAAGVTFVGPDPEALALFGDKARARALACEQDVPVLPGTEGPTTLARMQAFFGDQGAGTDGPPSVVVKSLAGGGGRGVRVVADPADLPRAFEECRAEALSAFGRGELYVERLLTAARHVEVQVVGDGTGTAAHLWDRDCSVQRRHQKLIEAAPAAVLADEERQAMLDGAVRLAGAAGLRGLATVEFLALPGGGFHFLEVNPRLQVEHTVTEEVVGVDLVAAQLRLAEGATLEEAGLARHQIPHPSGRALQIRINAETARIDGTFRPSAGRLTRFEPATGAGVRVDAAARTGAPVDPRFDSLLAKVVVHDRSGAEGARRLALRALEETRIEGVDTNLAFQAAILDSEDYAVGACDTGWVDRRVAELVERAEKVRLHRDEAPPAPAETPVPAAKRAPVDDERAVRAHLAGAVVALETAPGRAVAQGDVLAVVEAMKMQHPLAAPQAGRIAEVLVEPGDVVAEGDALVLLDADDAAEAAAAAHAEAVDPDHIRPDLAAFLDRRAKTYDEARPEAVAKRHDRGLRTARENIADLTDDGLSVEYGGLAVAAQRARRAEAELQARTPADGIVTGLGRVNGAHFGADRSTCAVLAYDYTVMAGTQGYFGHNKTDRLLSVARERGHPVVLFAEGGGGRPGETDPPMVAGLHYSTFARMGALSGTVPTIGIAAGRCFAGNAALLGTCDVVIATRDSTIGMGGPAMIEGGGLGVFTPEQVGPIDVQTRNGVVDIAVDDEAEAVAAAKRYLGYFQGPLADHAAADQRLLRHLIPEDRKRVYDVRDVLTTLCDTGSVLELRAEFGAGMITALARIEGRPVGVVANNPAVLGGAIDADAADKLARFVQLCDAFALPVVSLCDTPGFMVGPEAETTATVRHFSRLFVLAGHVTVPVVTVVLRKAYGLGAMAMAAGGFHHTSMTVAWPTGEFGGMGIEGAVRLSARDELSRIAAPEERRERFEAMVAAAYERGGALNTASHLEIDEVIDPADTRATLSALLPREETTKEGWANPRRRTGVDPW